jgi:hypothetical protein
MLDRIAAMDAEKFGSGTNHGEWMAVYRSEISAGTSAG